MRGPGVMLVGGHVTGKLDLSFARAQVTGDVFLTNIKASGEVSLSGAHITGQLSCVDATFSATEGRALNAHRLHVSEGLFWRAVKTREGGIDFSSAHAGDLVDHIECWPGAGRLILHGFTYDRISGATTEADARITWLEQGSTWKGEFFPQPFTHLAKVLREMGHDGKARKVLFRREQLIRSLGWLVGLILIAGMFAQIVWEEGSFAPNSGPVLVSQDWKEFVKKPGNPAKLWSDPGAPGQDWGTFYAGAWATDLVIPIIDLGQSDAWAVSTARGGWGRFLWWAQWLFILAGWVVTALGAAALTGVIRRE